MYILECADGSYYTGSTTDLERRLAQHQCGEGANHTKNRLPVKLIYYEKFPRIDQAFYREKQVQGWCRKKKEALINGCPELLPQLAVAYRDRDGGFECLNHRQVIDVVSEALEDTTSEALEDTTSETMQQ
jgi:putative endonuclease